MPVDVSTGEPSLPMTRPGTTQRLRSATTEMLDMQRVLQNGASVKSPSSASGQGRRQEGFRESNFNVEFKAFAPSVFASVCNRMEETMHLHFIYLCTKIRPTYFKFFLVNSF